MAKTQPPQAHMPDRELLERAAKAVGLDYRHEDGRIVDPRRGWAHVLTFWNPLVNDGDALRLAVKLGFHIELNTDDECLRDGDAAVEITAFATDVAHSIDESAGPDPYAATRRAIVRAAAAMAPKEPV